MPIVGMRVPILLSLVCLMSPSVGQALAQPLTVYVGAPTRGGFVDTTKDIDDSIKDLRKKLNGTKGVRFVLEPDGADLRVIVTGRGQGSEDWGRRVSLSDRYFGVELTSEPIALTTWWVASVLEVTNSDYRKELVGTYTHPPGLDYYGGAWTECAGRLAGSLKAWIEANAVRLRALKPGH